MMNSMFGNHSCQLYVILFSRVLSGLCHLLYIFVFKEKKPFPDNGHFCLIDITAATDFFCELFLVSTKYSRQCQVLSKRHKRVSLSL